MNVLMYVSMYAFMYVPGPRMCACVIVF